VQAFYADLQHGAFLVFFHHVHFIHLYKYIANSMPYFTLPYNLI
jgi:hypothetical protein